MKAKNDSHAVETSQDNIGADAALPASSPNHATAPLRVNEAQSIEANHTANVSVVSHDRHDMKPSISPEGKPNGEHTPSSPTINNLAENPHPAQHSNLSTVSSVSSATTGFGTLIDKASTPPTVKIGEKLLAARLKKGLTHADIYAHIKLIPRYTVAMENDNWAEFPTSSYARGFLRQYAKLLDISIEEDIEATPALQRVTPKKIDALVQSSSAVLTAHTPLSTWFMKAALVVVFFAGVILAVFLYRLDDAYFVSLRPINSSNSSPSKADHTQNTSTSMMTSILTSPSFMETGATIKQVAINDVVALSSSTPSQHNSAIATMTTPSAVALTTPSAQPTVVSTPSTQIKRERAAVPLIVDVAPNATDHTVIAKSPDSGEVPSRPIFAAKNIVITTETISWIEVKEASNRQTLSSKLLSKGDTFEYSVSVPFILVVGNASAARVTYGGKLLTLTNISSNDIARVLVTTLP